MLECTCGGSLRKPGIHIREHNTVIHSIIICVATKIWTNIKVGLVSLENNETRMTPGRWSHDL